MPSPPPPPSAGARRQRDVATSVAAWGSAALAVPALVATVALAFLGVMVGEEAYSEPSYIVPLVAAALVSVLVIGSGFWLLRGYWRVRSGRMPAGRRARFWWLSAAYNAVAAAAVAWALADQITDVPRRSDPSYADLLNPFFVLSAAFLCWTLWMVATGTQKAAAAEPRAL